jgi:hypothetical protein
VGVFVTRAVDKGLGKSWLKVGKGLPNAPITSLDWQEKTRTLLASNFGRGAYSVALPGLGRAAAPGAKGKGAPAPVAVEQRGTVTGVAPATAGSGAGGTSTADAVAAVPTASSAPAGLPLGALAALAGVALLGLLALRPRRRRG